MVLFISSWRSRILSSRSNCLRKSSAEVFTRGSILTSNDRVCALRSEEHTSELQSRLHLVCRLLLEKKKQHLFSCGTWRCRIADQGQGVSVRPRPLIEQGQARVRRPRNPHRHPCLSHYRHSRASFRT